MRRLIFALALLAALPSVASAAIIAGTASYYNDPNASGLYAAVPSWHFGDHRYSLKVCRQDQPSRCVTVTVRDFCQCYVGTSKERIIDLSPEAFKRLAPLSAGLVHVFVEEGQPDRGAPNQTPPPTDATAPAAPAVFGSAQIALFLIGAMAVMWLLLGRRDDG